MTHFIHAPNATFLVTLLAVGGALVGSGCSSTGAAAEPPSAQERANATTERAKSEAVKTAARAQRKADEARREASRQSAEAAEEANAAIAEANQKARGEGAQAQANANVEVRKLNRKTAKETTGLREWSQRKMDNLDNAIDAARAKEQIAAPEQRSTFETGMKAVEIRRDAMRADVAAIQTQSAKDMADFKERLDAEAIKLNDRVHELSASLAP